MADPRAYLLEQSLKKLLVRLDRATRPAPTEACRANRNTRLNRAAEKLAEDLAEYLGEE
jgi:hypothetical protein